MTLREEQERGSVYSRVHSRTDWLDRGRGDKVASLRLTFLCTLERKIQHARDESGEYGVVRYLYGLCSRFPRMIID